MHTDEVYFRDTAHGFLAWSVATLLTAALLSSVAGLIVGAGAQAGATVASGAATAAGQSPLPILETTAIRSIETVLRQEPNAITIFARDVLAGMEDAGHCAALPYRLSWNLPPVSFFTLKELEAHPTVQSLRGAVVQTALRMKRPAG